MGVKTTCPFSTNCEGKGRVPSPKNINKLEHNKKMPASKPFSLPLTVEYDLSDFYYVYLKIFMKVTYMLDFFTINLVFLENL